MLHEGTKNHVIGRFENVELFHVGQFAKLGRYPIHFHMAGNIADSYIRKCAIHQTFNRGITIHGVHQLRVQNNVIYDTLGHTIFLEDGGETQNVIEYNLIILTKQTFSLLVIDSTPASIWIRHPDNIIRGNHCAGSDHYGTWLDVITHPSGPSIDTNVCPRNSKLGVFEDNVTHSNARYGLRIHDGLLPRKYPCLEMPSDPFNDSNPHILAKFENHLSYKNRKNGSIAERLGYVQFLNFKVADNRVGGMEVSLTEDIDNGYAKISDALIVGRSANTEADLDDLEIGPHGIITPRSEGFTVENVQFYNFNHWEDGAALGTCSHCFHAAATDSGARTVTVRQLTFDETVPKRIRYQYPFRAIFYDEDGSLTDQDEHSWATAYWSHNEIEGKC
jgi:hypothetical protein